MAKEKEFVYKYNEYRDAAMSANKVKLNELTKERLVEIILGLKSVELVSPGDFAKRSFEQHVLTKESSR